MSAISNKHAPNAADAGMRYLRSPPTNILAICGANKHTKPIAPIKLTTVAVARHERTIATSLTPFTLTPNDFAESSHPFVSDLYPLKEPLLRQRKISPSPLRMESATSVRDSNHRLTKIPLL